MTEYTFFGLLFFGCVLATVILYIAVDYTERRIKRRRWLKKERKKQRRKRRTRAVVQQAYINEIAEECGYGKEL